MPHRRPEPRYTLLIVPDPGQGEVRQVSVGVAELRRWSVAAAVVLGTILSVAVVGEVGSVPGNVPLPVPAVGMTPPPPLVAQPSVCA